MELFDCELGEMTPLLTKVRSFVYTETNAFKYTI